MGKDKSVSHDVKVGVLVGAILGVLGVIGTAILGLVQGWLPQAAAVWHWLGSSISVPVVVVIPRRCVSSLLAIPA